VWKTGVNAVIPNKIYVDKFVEKFMSYPQLKFGIVDN
jgi:hypothetical protein